MKSIYHAELENIRKYLPEAEKAFAAYAQAAQADYLELLFEATRYLPLHLQKLNDSLERIAKVLEKRQEVIETAVTDLSAVIDELKTQVDKE